MELHSLDKRNSHSSHSVPPAVQANTEKHHLEERRGKQQETAAGRGLAREILVVR